MTTTPTDGWRLALSPRARAARLYRGRRQGLLEVPVEALRRAGLDPSVDPDAHWARATLDTQTDVEVGFVGRARVFGVLIDTRWTARRRVTGAVSHELRWRFGAHGGFRSTPGTPLVGRLNSDPVLRRLVDAGELRRFDITTKADAITVSLGPLPGTLTALYLPPLPPTTVALRPAEADAHIALLARTLDILTPSARGPDQKE